MYLLTEITIKNHKTSYLVRSMVKVRRLIIREGEATNLEFDKNKVIKIRQFQTLRNKHKINEKWEINIQHVKVEITQLINPF
jgi:hypothetical protein